MKNTRQEGAGIWLKRLGVIASGAFLIACNTMGTKSYSPASQQMRNDSWYVNTSYLEACGVGIVAGGVIGAISGDDSDERKKRALVGAGAGCVLAMGANWWLQGQRESAAYQEQDMKQALATIKEDNKKLSGLVRSSKAVVAEDKRKIRQIDKAYRNKTISLQDARAQMAEVDDNEAHLKKTLANLEERRNNWKQLGGKLRASQSQSDVREMDNQIASLEKKIGVLKGELSSLEQTRRVSAIG